MMKKMIQKIKDKFKKQETYEMPYERAVIVWNPEIIELGIQDDMNKEIWIYEGNEVIRKDPYSKARVKVLQEVENIPVYDGTKKDKLIEGEEITPPEIYYETI